MGVSDLAQHFFNKAGITAIRRLRKSDNLRVARACGATIVNRTDEITESDIGTGCGLFEIRKIGDEYFTFMEKCKDPKAFTILLRGASKDILNEVERNLQDALNVARNLYQYPFLVPGGAATEMEVAHLLGQKCKSLNGVIQWPYKAIASALEVIPRTLAQNCGANTIRTLTALRAKHAQEAEKNVNWGINGETGLLADMAEEGIWEPLAVKLQVYKTAVETAILLLRIDDIVNSEEEDGGLNCGLVHLQLDGKRFPDAFFGHVGQQSGLSVDTPVDILLCLLCVLSSESGEGSDGVGTAILGQGAGDHLKGRGNSLVWPLNDSIEGLGLLAQQMSNLHLSSSSTGHKERVLVQVPGNIESILKVSLNF